MVFFNSCKMILKGQVGAMITENQVKNYLRSKDKDYVNKLIESLYEQDSEVIDPSHKVCLISSFQEEWKE